MSRDLGHVADLVASALKIRNYVSAVTVDGFLQDDMRQSAVLHQFTIIGEASRRVSAAYRAAHPEVNWAGIVGLRNKIVHDYEDINLDHVWRIATQEVPGLIAALAALLPPQPDGEDENF